MHLLTAAIWMTLASVQADEDCGERLRDPELERGERAMDVLLDPRCKTHREAALSELEDWLSTPPTRSLSDDDLDDPELEASSRAARSWLVTGQRVRLALEANDVATARMYLGKLPDLHAHEFMEPAASSRRRIVAILDGQAVTPHARFDAPGDWILRHGRCGTPLAGYLAVTGVGLSIADAWRAMGRPDLATAQVLQDEWMRAVSLGTVPPRLREHAEAWLGRAGYEREVEIALRGLRLEEGVAGTRLTLPLLGHALPLPVGYQLWDEPEAIRFPSAEAAALHYRAWLLAESDDSPESSAAAPPKRRH